VCNGIQLRNPHTALHLRVRRKPKSSHAKQVLQRKCQRCRVTYDYDFVLSTTCSRGVIVLMIACFLNRFLPFDAHVHE
jgi:hypothetical protein